MVIGLWRVFARAFPLGRADVSLIGVATVDHVERHSIIQGEDRAKFDREPTEKRRRKPFDGRNNNGLEPAHDLFEHQRSGRQFRAEMVP
jgi:hypothetical protein